MRSTSWHQFLFQGVMPIEPDDLFKTIKIHMVRQSFGGAMVFQVDEAILGLLIF